MKDEGTGTVLQRDSGVGEEGTCFLESGCQGEQYLPGPALLFRSSESFKGAGLSRVSWWPSDWGQRAETACSLDVAAI